MCVCGCVGEKYKLKMKMIDAYLHTEFTTHLLIPVPTARGVICDSINH